jgi:hypothetical protein
MRKNDKLTITRAVRARPRFIWGGSESRFISRMAASENETIIKVKIDPESTNFVHLCLKLNPANSKPHGKLSLNLPILEGYLHSPIWGNAALPSASLQVC